jgi:hypothetical protein
MAAPDKPQHFRMSMHKPDVDTTSSGMSMQIIPHGPGGGDDPRDPEFTEVLPVINREEWMTRFAGAMVPYFQGAGLAIPTKMRFGIGRLIGFGKADAIGRCHPHTWSSDGTTEITVDLSQDDSRSVAATIVHEMVHAAVGNSVGHGAPFRRAMGKVGLVGNPTSTEPSMLLCEFIDQFVREHGPFPHAAMASNRPRRRKLADSQGYLKLTCPICGWFVRMTRKMLRIAAPPCCNPECPQLGQELVVEGATVEPPHPDQPQDSKEA